MPKIRTGEYPNNDRRITMEIERGSRAWRELFEALNDAETRKVSIDVRPDGLAVKVNEFMWTLALDVRAPNSDSNEEGS